MDSKKMEVAETLLVEVMKPWVRLMVGEGRKRGEGEREGREGKERGEGERGGREGRERGEGGREGGKVEGREGRERGERGREGGKRKEGEVGALVNEST